MRRLPLVLGCRQIQASHWMHAVVLAADVSGLQRIVDASAAWWPSRLKSPAIRPIEMIFYLNRPLDDGVISETTSSPLTSGSGRPISATLRLPLPDRLGTAR